MQKFLLRLPDQQTCTLLGHSSYVQWRQYMFPLDKAHMPFYSQSYLNNNLPNTFVYVIKLTGHRLTYRLDLYAGVFAVKKCVLPGKYNVIQLHIAKA